MAHSATPPAPAGADDLAPITGVDRLLDHGLAGLRRVALDVVSAGLRAADPGVALDRLVTVDRDRMRVSARTFDLASFGSVVVLGAGKATMPIAAALERKLGGRISRGLVVCRAGDDGGASLGRVEVIEADHPVPSQASRGAAVRLNELAAECGPGDLVITAFTGGSSALACLPAKGISFADKQRLHSLLLDSGASIREVNTVRKHTSAIKGGRLAARMAGATIVNLTVSDVVGDALDLLCDAVVQDTTTPSDAVDVLERYDLWGHVSAEVRAHLRSPDAVSPSLADADITSCVLVTGTTVAELMADRARAVGCTPVILGSRLEGEAVSLGGLLGSLSRESFARGEPFTAGAMLIGAGGESTVSIRRDAGAVVGSGGPNQEVAIGFARAVAGATTPVAGVFIDSDGSDGGTHAAGGCVDSDTLANAERRGVDLNAAIAHHDSGAALEQLGDLVLTGPTGTNISDLIVVALGHAPPDGPGGQS